MNELAVVDKGVDWRRLKALVLDSVSSPITKRVYNLGLDEFFALVRPGAAARLHQGDRGRLESRSGRPRAGPHPPTCRAENRFGNVFSRRSSWSVHWKGNAQTTDRAGLLSFVWIRNDKASYVTGAPAGPGPPALRPLWPDW